MYGEDSIADSELLFLSIINHGKEKMYEDNPELKILRKVYIWFNNLLTVSNPDSILTGYPYFSSSNLNEIANLLNALGTGISDLKIVEVPVDIIKSNCLLYTSLPMSSSRIPVPPRATTSGIVRLVRRR